MNELDVDPKEKKWGESKKSQNLKVSIQIAIQNSCYCEMNS